MTEAGEWILVRTPSVYRPFSFRVWAPRAKAVSVHVCDPRRNPVPMEPREFGYFEVTIESVRPGDRYHYMSGRRKGRPDPASRSQPDGVHQASAVVDPDVFGWTDQAWRGLPAQQT